MLKTLLTFILYLFIFLATLYHPWDYDLGWHLRVGRDTIETGYPYTNTYSWELPGYQWFNSSPLLDVPRYIVYKYFGMPGIAIFGAILGVLIFFFISKYCQLDFQKQCLVFPIFLWFENSIFVQSFKGQIVSLLFLAILITLLFSFQNGRKKVIFLLIPIFLLWANLHAQFVLGLIIFAIWSMVYILINFKRNLKSVALPLLLTFVFSLIVTLANPYGMDIYKYALINTTNPQIFQTIEFTPPEIFSKLWWNLLIWGIFLLINTLLILKNRHLNKYFPLIVISAILFYLSLTMKRYAWSMYLLSIPIATYFLLHFSINKNRYLKIFSYFFFLISFIYISLFELPKRNLHDISWNGYCVFVRCSPAGAEVLLKMKNLPARPAGGPAGRQGVGKLYNYNPWGGWLIWNYPQIKPNVDGRMSFWEDPKTGHNPVRFAASSNMLTQHQIDSLPYDTYFIPNQLLLVRELESLSQRSKKWKRIFRDYRASIYTRMD